MIKLIIFYVSKKSLNEKHNKKNFLNTHTHTHIREIPLTGQDNSKTSEKVAMKF